MTPTHFIRWTISFVLIAAFGSAAVVAADMEVSSILQFSALDGSASDEDGAVDGVLTLNSLTITGGDAGRYRATLATGVTDLSGNSLTQDFERMVLATNR